MELESARREIPPVKKGKGARENSMEPVALGWRDGYVPRPSVSDRPVGLAKIEAASKLRPAEKDNWRIFEVKDEQGLMTFKIEHIPCGQTWNAGSESVVYAGEWSYGRLYEVLPEAVCLNCMRK